MDLWTELFAEDAVNHFPFHSSFLGGLNIFGRDEVLAAWSGYLQDFESVSLPVDAIYIDEVEKRAVARAGSHNIVRVGPGLFAARRVWDTQKEPVGSAC